MTRTEIVSTIVGTLCGEKDSCLKCAVCSASPNSQRVASNLDALPRFRLTATGSGRVDEDQVVEVLAAALNNRALCHKGLGDYGAMYADASSCLEIQPKNVKVGIDVICSCT